MCVCITYNGARVRASGRLLPPLASPSSRLALFHPRLTRAPASLHPHIKQVPQGEMLEVEVLDTGLFGAASLGGIEIDLGKEVAAVSGWV